jgi:hypothetical protein
MVIRALFPETAEGPRANAVLARHVQLLDELVDRLFLKLRLPGVELAPEDLETPEYRASLRALLDALRSERGSEEPDNAGLRLVTFVDPATVADLASALGGAPLATAAPWRSTAVLMGTSLERDGVVVASFAAYRDAVERALTELAGLSPADFEAALQRPGFVDLEVERETVLRELAAQRNVPA